MRVFPRASHQQGTFLRPAGGRGKKAIFSRLPLSEILLPHFSPPRESRQSPVRSDTLGWGRAAWFSSTLSLLGWGTLPAVPKAREAWGKEGGGGSSPPQVRLSGSEPLNLVHCSTRASHPLALGKMWMLWLRCSSLASRTGYATQIWVSGSLSCEICFLHRKAYKIQLSGSDKLKTKDFSFFWHMHVAFKYTLKISQPYTHLHKNKTTVAET